MSQPVDPPSGELSPSVALLAACAPDHHQALDPSHFPDCGTCLTARDYFIGKETTKKHHAARSLAREVEAPEFPLGYAPADLRTYRRPRVPGTPDPVQLLLPGRTRPVLPIHTPTPTRDPELCVTTTLKRKRNLSFREELLLERQADEEVNKCTSGSQSSPYHQDTLVYRDTPSCPDDEIRRETTQDCFRHDFDKPNFVPSLCYGTSIRDTPPALFGPQSSTTSSIPSLSRLSPSVHSPQSGSASNSPTRSLELIQPLGAHDPYLYGLLPPQLIRDPSPPPPSRGMQFASRICGTAASIGSGAINLVNNAVNTILGRPSPRHVPVDSAGQILPTDQPANQAPKRRRVDGSGELFGHIGESSSITQTRPRPGSASPQREYGKTSSYPEARRATTAPPIRQNARSAAAAAAQPLSNIDAATPRQDDSDLLQVRTPGGDDVGDRTDMNIFSPMDIDEPSLTEINPSANHVISTIEPNQSTGDKFIAVDEQIIVQQRTAQQHTNKYMSPSVADEQPTVERCGIGEIPVQQTDDEQSGFQTAAFEQYRTEQTAIGQPEIEQQDVPEQKQQSLPDPATIPAIDNISRFNPMHPDFVKYGLSEDEDSEDERDSARRLVEEWLPRSPGLMRVKAFQTPRERMQRRERRAKKAKQRQRIALGSERNIIHSPQYKDINDFFDNDDAHAIKGFFKEFPRLVPNGRKLTELEYQYQERLRKEEEERREAERKAEEERREALRKVEEERRAAEREKQRKEQGLWSRQLEELGLRRPNATMIAPVNETWEQKVQDALEGRTGKIKTPGPEVVELTARDFGRLVPESAWLNDSCVTAALTLAAKYVNDKAGVIIKQGTPKCVTLNTYFWSQLCSSGPAGKGRMLKRVWGLTPENFLDVETLIVPVNLHSHWSFAIVRPSRREIAYVDSFQQKHEDRLIKIREFLQVFLETRYNADEWKTVHFKVPVQTNSWDCGVFTITNTMYLAMGIDASGYTEADMPLQRRRLAAAILNGGFSGDFDLSPL